MIRRAGVFSLVVSLAACATPDPPRPPLERATPLPRAASEAPTPTARPRPIVTATPTVAPSVAAPQVLATATPGPRASTPAGYWALEAIFTREGAAVVRETVTAESALAGTTDGQGYARLVLAERPLPAVLALAVAGRPVGDLYLAAGEAPRLNPQPGWAVRLGRTLERP